MNELMRVITEQWPALLGGAALLILLIKRRGSSAKDPKRAFDSQQRQRGFMLASAQCEMNTRWWTRCTATASHADHFYPHTKGGASSMPNLVAACAPHNLSKGAKLPSVIDRTLIARRRRSYFPAGIECKPGEWYRGRS